MKGELYNPKNPEYAAISDTESAKGALDSMLMQLRANKTPVSLGDLRDPFCQRLPEEIKKELILRGLNRLATRAPHADAYQAVYDETLMVEGVLRAAGAFTPRNAKAPGPPKRTREQRLAALGGGSRRGDDDSRRNKKPSPWGYRT